MIVMTVEIVGVAMEEIAEVAMEEDVVEVVMTTPTVCLC